ncbi:ankyrin [Xylaria arbuscula]|nr:ankyrin [Xylaria arbuscula]
MEALGVGANAVALIVLAAKLSKTVYTSFHSIKDGPENVRNVASDILRLHGALETLESYPLANDMSLSEQIKTCFLGLSHLSETIQKLQYTSDERRTGRMWKRFRCFINEKKLDEIHSRINVHTSAIHFRLSILQSISSHGILSDVQLTRQSIVDIEQRLNQESNTQSAGFAALDKSLRSSENSRNEALSNGLSSVRTAVEDASSVSRADATNMLDLLHELKGLVISQNKVHHTQSAETISDCAKDESGKIGKDPCDMSRTSNVALSESIARLCDLIEVKDRSFDTDTKAYCQDGTIKDEVRSNLRRFSQGFGQYNFTVNPPLEERNANTVVAQREQKITWFQLDGLGGISVMTSKGLRQPSPAEEDNSTSVIDQNQYKITVTFLPIKGSKFNMLVASTIQQGRYANPAQSISSLAVNRVLPPGSRVFDVVSQGDFKSVLDSLVCDVGVESSQENINRAESRRLLLEAGVDPTLRPGTACSFLESILFESSPETIRTIFRQLQHPININSIIDGELTPLLILCASHPSDVILEKLSLLSELGADIHARDLEGRSCLHICLPKVSRTVESSREIIKFLIKNGADIHARDKFGQTAYEWAYKHFDHRYGSRAGDIWDVVIRECGYDICQFRWNCQRRPYYTRWYQRRNFEKLWEGRESQCPYWDDNPWPLEAPYHPPVHDRLSKYQAKKTASS